jgi:hypothetical protein
MARRWVVRRRGWLLARGWTASDGAGGVTRGGAEDLSRGDGWDGGWTTHAQGERKGHKIL